MLSEDTYIDFVAIFILLFLVFYGLSFFFKKAKRKMSTLKKWLLVVIGGVVFLSGFWGYSQFRQQIFLQGVPVGETLGKGENYSWCLQQAKNQFLEGSEFEAQIKIEGFVVGCLSVATADIELCENLSAEAESSLIRDYCGNGQICESVHFAAEVFCDLE